MVISVNDIPLTYTNVDGTYEIPTLPEGELTLKFYKIGYGIYEEIINLTNGANLELNVELYPPTGYSLFCIVRKNVAIPVDGALVEILNTDLSGTTSNQGQCTITNIPAGTYDIRISKSGYVTHTEDDFIIDSNEELIVILEEE
mgnify:FL=1